MKLLLTLVFAGFLGLSASAQDASALVEPAPVVLDVREAADTTTPRRSALNCARVALALC